MIPSCVVASIRRNYPDTAGKRLRASLVAIEFTTRGQSPMRASICFASITEVLLNKIKKKIHFEYVKGKHSFQFEVKVKKYNFHT